jgi:hypothetical protein
MAVSIRATAVCAVSAERLRPCAGGESFSNLFTVAGRLVYFAGLGKDSVSVANSLSLTSGVDQTRVFQCPHCKQTIDTSAQQCRFCSASIDPVEAELAAVAMARLNRACSDASYLTSAAIAMLVFLFVQFVPILVLVGLFGFYFLLFAIPVWAVAWWVRFWNIQTDDNDFRRARWTTLLIGVPISLWLLKTMTGFIVSAFFHAAR